MSIDLPKKEAQLFRKALLAYENRSYTISHKLYKQITSNPSCANNGKVLSLNGLIQNGLGNKELAVEYAKKGLKNDPRSSICWHIYGIILRNDKKYTESLKCYKTAWRMNKENIQILRDLSLLEIQTRDISGFIDSTRELLRNKPTLKSSWLGYSVALYLSGDYDLSIEVLRSMEKSMKSHVKSAEHSQLILFMARVMIKSQKPKEALAYLRANDSSILDKTSFLETLADIFILLNNHKQAEHVVDQLITKNPHSDKYVDLMVGLVGEDCYEQLHERFPKSTMIFYKVLENSRSEEFRVYVEKYLTDSFEKGIPSFFESIKDLYRYEEKGRIMGEIVHHMEQNQERNPHFVLMINLFLAQHYDVLGDSYLALKYIKKCINHTPTHIDLYLIMARIYENCGNLLSALKCAQYAESLDTADRYLNNTTMRYLLLTDQVEEAEKCPQRFIKIGLDPATFLDEMQCMWYLLLAAESYSRTKNASASLQKCEQILKHYEEMVDDEFDFHTYCLRKLTLLEYLDLLEFQTRLFDSEDFIKTCGIVLKEAESPDVVWRFLSNLRGSGDGRVALMFYEYYKGRNKPFLMLKAIRIVLRDGRCECEAHMALVEFLKMGLGGKFGESAEFVAKFEEFVDEVGGRNIGEYNKAFVEKNCDSIKHVITGIVVRKEMGEDVDEDMRGVCEGAVPGKMGEYVWAMEQVEKAVPEWAESFRGCGLGRFPMCWRFGGGELMQEEELMVEYDDLEYAIASLRI